VDGDARQPIALRAASASAPVAVKKTRAPACASARDAFTAPSPYPSAFTTADTAALGAALRKKRQFSTMAA